jgi:hypothetical protein
VQTHAPVSLGKLTCESHGPKPHQQAPSGYKQLLPLPQDSPFLFSSAGYSHSVVESSEPFGLAEAEQDVPNAGSVSGQNELHGADAGLPVAVSTLDEHASEDPRTNRATLVNAVMRIGLAKAIRMPADLHLHAAP